jgi:hypothetical protein
MIVFCNFTAAPPPPPPGAPAAPPPPPGMGNHLKIYFTIPKLETSYSIDYLRD